MPPIVEADIVDAAFASLHGDTDACRDLPFDKDLSLVGRTARHRHILILKMEHSRERVPDNLWFLEERVLVRF
jgi:hypothetical protein